MAIREEVTPEARNLVDMAWDPITRIVGNLGIYTKIDFDNREVVECKSTSSLFRGYSVFMKGKDPRDAHFITSRICGICGDNHAVCSVYAQNMAYGVKTPHLGEWIMNLGEAAEFMFDHTIYQDNLLFVDYCEQMVRETNPSWLERAETTEAPNANIHGFHTIADLMRSLNPFTGATYVEALQMSRLTREMFCLMEGRHVHPSTIYPGGVGTVPTPQLFTDYLVRLMRCMDWVKKIVPITDDLFDFFYDITDGEYGKVGYRRTLLGCWGAFQNPDVVNYTYEGMNDAGNGSFVTPGIVVDGELVTTNLVDINLGLRILLGHSFYDDWEQEEPFVTRDPLGNPVDQRHPWNQTTLPKPQKRDFDKNYSWVMSPRWLDERTGDHLALDTGGGPLARLWATALAGLVDTGYVKATGNSVEINLPGTSTMPETSFEWKIPEQGSNTLERGRARAYFIAYSAAQAVYFVEKALELVRAGRYQGLPGVRGTGRGHRLRLPRGGTGGALAPHGDPGRQDRQLSSLPANAVERVSHRLIRHSRSLRGRGAEHPDLRGERPGQLQGHRHHALRAQLRPVPALRRAHVPRQGQDAPEAALPDHGLRAGG